MLQITNIDKNTEDIICYIVKKAGGKVVDKQNRVLFDGNKDFNEIWNNVVEKSTKHAKKNSSK